MHKIYFPMQMWLDVHRGAGPSQAAVLLSHSPQAHGNDSTPARWPGAAHGQPAAARMASSA